MYCVWHIERMSELQAILYRKFFFAAFLYFFQLLLFLSKAQPRQNGPAELWRGAPSPPYSPSSTELWRGSPSMPTSYDISTDPMLVAREAGNAGRNEGFQQQLSQYASASSSKNRQTSPLHAYPNAKATPGAEGEPPILNGICNIPNLNPCVSNAKCVATVPIVGRAACTCPPGFGGDGKRLDLGGEGCVNIDECRSDLHNCDLHSQDCVDVQGLFYCKCKPGFASSPSGKVCLDIDECQNLSLHNCKQETSVCHNLEGSFRCDCKDKTMIMDEVTGICRDLDECNEMGGAMNPCEQICINQIEGVNCGCSAGYRLRSDGRTCEDVDECEHPSLHYCDPQGQISRCVNTIGDYTCECNSELGYKTAEDGKSCMNLNECVEYPYICGGALSCCKDLIPPQRFACSMPIDDDSLMNPTNVNNAIDAIASPLTDAYTVPFAAMNSMPAAAFSLPNALSRLATAFPIGSFLGGFTDLNSPRFENISPPSSYMGGEIGGQRTLQEFHDGREKTTTMIEEENAAHKKMLRGIEENNKISDVRNGDEDGFFVDGDQKYIVVTANNSTSDGIKNKMIGLYNLQKYGPATPRRLQLLSGILPRVFEVGSSVLRSPAQLLGGGGRLLDIGSLLGPQAVGTGGGAGGGLRIGRGSTCPYGFSLGGDLYRAKVYDNTRQVIKSVVTSRLTTGTDGDGAPNQLIQPELFSDGLIQNTKAIADELTRWYSELSKTPMEVAMVASDAVSGSPSSPLNLPVSALLGATQGEVIPPNIFPSNFF